MKKILFVSLFSSIAIFNISCDAETIAALTEAASSFLEKTPGCMNAGNATFNPEADTHVQDSCAVQIYGCTDATALNFLATATNMCAGISANQCCTTTTSGCTDPNYVNYSEAANSDDGSCSGTIDHGCMTSSACNFNPNATADCSKVTGGTNTNCCVPGSTTPTVCVQDLDNDGFQDSGTTSQTLAVNNCGCSTLGVGYTDITDTNGEAIYGCQNPICPEFDPTANIDDGNCCLGFSALDSLLMFGEDFADCASDPTLCVETAAFSLMGGYIADMSDCEDQMMGPDNFHDELFVFLGWGGEYYEEFLSIHELSGYRAEPKFWPSEDNPQSCEDKAGSSHWFCGNQIADVEEYRPCEEEIFAGDCDMWLHNEATDQWVENPNGREECWWESPECRWKPNEVIDACWTEENQASQSACTFDPGCQWDDGGYAEFNSVQWEPYCYFDCWGLNQTKCDHADLTNECSWETPDATDGYCVAPSVPANCVKMDGTVDASSTTENACWQAGHMWEAGNCVKSDGTVDSAIKSGPACWDAGHTWQDQWMACNELGVSGTSGNCVGDASKTTKQACETGTCKKPDGTVDSSITTDQACWDAGYEWDWPMGWWDSGPSDCYGENDWETGDFVCKCSVPDGTNAAADCAAKCTGCEWKTLGDAQCEWKQIVDACNSYTDPTGCNSAPATENCEWDYMSGWCFKEQGADCWGLDSSDCQGNIEDCEWWMPPGYTPLSSDSPWYGLADEGVCHFFDWCNEYYCYEGECDENGCQGDDYCKWQDIPGQPKTCVEDRQAQYCECYIEWNQADCTAESGATWDAIHHECMWNIDQYACNHEDDIMLGPEDGNIDCSEYMADNIEQYTEWNGTDGVCEMIFEDTLEGTWSIVGNTLCIEKIGVFEEEACNLLEFEECQCNLHRCNWTHQATASNPDAGVCAEGSQDPGQQGGGRVQGVEHYKIKTVSPVFQDEMINYIFGGNAPEDCLSFSLQDNGNVHITSPKPGGGTCTIIFKPEGSDGS